MNVLGINAYHGDVSAALVRDGELVAAVEEERFRRVKHWAGFPAEAIRSCLEMGGLEPEDVDHFAVSRDPRAHMWRKALYTLRRRPGLGLVRDRARNRSRIVRRKRRKSTRVSNTTTPTIIIRLVGRSIRSQAASTADIRSVSGVIGLQ